MADESYYRNLLRESVSALRQAVELDDKTAKKLEKIKLRIRPAKSSGIAEYRNKKRKLAGLYVKILGSGRDNITAGQMYDWIREYGPSSGFSHLNADDLQNRLLKGKLSAEDKLPGRLLNRIMSEFGKEMDQNTSSTCYETGFLRRRIAIESSDDRSMLISDLGSELGHVIVETVRPYRRAEHLSISEAYDIAFNDVLTKAMEVKSGVADKNEKVKFGEEYMAKVNAGRGRTGIDVVREIVRERKLSDKEIREGVYDSVVCGANGIPAHCVGFYIVSELKKTLGKGYAKAMFDYLHEPKINMSDPQKFIDGVKVFGLVRKHPVSAYAKSAYA